MPKAQRSIPAHAGGTPSCSGTATVSGVYPRARGGNHDRVLLLPLRFGLSPRTRGEPRPRCGPAQRSGSIPAHAGGTLSPLPGLGLMEVYPRARGGNKSKSKLARLSCGLSPRTRGEPQTRWSGPRRPGSIPAHAGGTLARRRGRVRHGVYPRARGGNRDKTPAGTSPRGLSPRTRGEPRIMTRRCRPVGSIPAHAGGTARSAPLRRWRSVYPRARGGNGECGQIVVHDSGLSPRTRGELRRGT